MTESQQFDELRRDRTDPHLNVGRYDHEENPAEWDRPGHDGLVSDHDTDPDRRDVRAEIGKYVSLVPFPTTAAKLADTAASKLAPDETVRILRELDPAAEFKNTRELWIALGLEANERF